ncbi:MAG: pseudouridine synthase, partial [bacterium]
MRLDKLLSNLRYETRSGIKDAIKAGRVTVGGEVSTDPGRVINPETEAICVDDIPVFYRKWVYLMMNKPTGVVSANRDDRYPTAVGLVGPPYDRFDLSICGRLDLDAEGLLLLTNDGETLHRVISPKNDIFKEYVVLLSRPLGDVSALTRGVAILDGKNETYTTKPAKIVRTGEREYHIWISEGKFHQVKRMFAAVGNEVLTLKRVAIGGLGLDLILVPG